MRILFLTQYFPPETGAPSNRLSDLADRLANLGHQVTVLTALPNYPQGVIFDGYRGHFMMTEKRNSIQVIRSWIFATRSKKFLPKLINYFSFAILSCLVGAFMIKSPDIVFVESPPLFLAVSGYLLVRIKRAKFVLNISDLWPESAIALGVLRNPRVIRWSVWLERELYRRAALVTGQTQGIMAGVRNRWPSARRALLTNGVAPEFLLQVEAVRFSRAKLRQELGFGDKFLVAYTGVHGFSQRLETILRAAELLSSYKEIQFIFWGDGPEKPGLKAMAIAMRLSNVQFLPSQPSSRMPEVLTSVDVSIVPLARTELFKGALPSKLFEALGAGVPVIAAVEGEASSLVEASGGGIIIEPENAQQMADAVVRLFMDSPLRQKLSVDGRNYVAMHYNRKTIAERFENLLIAVKSSSLHTSSEGSVDSEVQLNTLNLPGEKYSKYSSAEIENV
jgi:glycosyltransferase involved in cell wall biosynthesis